MKKTISVLVLFTGISLFGKALPASYTITKSAEDKQLKKTEALFEFTFYDQRGEIIKNEITFSYNTDNKKQKPNATGKIIDKVKPGKYAYQFFYNFDYFEITTDSILIKPGYRTEISVNFMKAEEARPMKKPVIYVYPTKKENVCIDLELKGSFSFTYPEYKNGWNFIANPDGSIEMNNKKYHYLFWDGYVNMEKSKLNLNEGFIVENKDLITFFEEKLKLMGLNSQEIQDYITYWCPLMTVNESNYIHFMFNNECNEYAKMNITPKPDHTFRVYMLWSDAKDHVPVAEQKIESFQRNGFTVVEWGGSEMNAINLPHRP